MVVLLALDMFYVYFPLYIQSLGLSLSKIGLVLAAQAALNFFVSLIIPNLINKIGLTKVLWIFMVIGTSAFALIPFSKVFIPLFIVAFILGAGLGITQPITIIPSYTFSPMGRSGEVLRVRLAQTVVPLIIAGVNNFTGLGSIFIVNSLSLLFGAYTAHGISLSNKEEIQERKKREKKYYD